MRGSVLLAFALALPVLGAGEARPAPVGGLAVLRATVRFSHDGRANIRIDGDLGVTGGLASLGPLGAGLRLSLGPAGLLDGVPAEARTRVLPDGSWRVALRRAFGGKGRLSLTLDPSNGALHLDARGIDGTGLLAAGPTGVSCSAEAGETTGSEPVTFEVHGRRWEFRRVTPPRPGPGGGGGGGGPPLPPGATTVAQGAVSGITTYRFEVIGDDAAWQALWLAHAGSGPAPAVDFATEMVVGIWLGPRPTGGYTASITGFTPATVLGVPCSDTVCPPEGVVVNVLESQPGGKCATPPVVSYPFHIVRVARTVWGGVMVEIATRVEDCF